MTSTTAKTPGIWIGAASTSIVPPADYWAVLAGEVRQAEELQQIEKLRQQSDRRVGELVPSRLPPPESTAARLLERVAADGWFERRERRICPDCGRELDAGEAAQAACPECDADFHEHGGVQTEVVYVRHLARSRAVDWMVAIHGMNTTGAWQEEFSWHFGTTWGRSVPVAVYKYGKIVPGVIMTWRRRQLRDRFRDKLAAMRDQAAAQGFAGKPDLVAHSFGTWLFGHVLEHELTRQPEDRLKFGRVILTGCVLRPDFDWRRIKDAGLVEEVLNHYGSKDIVVPLAHMAIWDSGPSGRRGFDGDEAINACAEGYGHSDLFSTEKWVVDGRPLQKAPQGGGVTHLEHTYKRVWRPFLTLPAGELGRLPDRRDPETTWRPLPWLLRGTLMPFFALPLLLALIVLALTGVGRVLLAAWPATAWLTGGAAAGFVVLLGAVAAVYLWRRFRS